MSLRSRTAGALALLAPLACDGRGESGPLQSPPAASAEPAAPAESPAPTTVPRGWWRGAGVCLELFANGDFEISVFGSDPKVLVFGGARLTPAGPDAFAVELTAAKIWKGRFTSPCRRHSELGDWAESQDVLGVRFTPGGVSSLTLRRAGEDALELCGERCETLRRETPILGARWRRAGLANPSHPTSPWAPGDLLELDLGEGSSHVWTGGEGAQPATAYGDAVVTSLGDDRFRVDFTPRFFADIPPGATPTLFDTPLPAGQTRTLSARRLPDQKLEACDGAHCATLERQFDAYEYRVK